MITIDQLPEQASGALFSDCRTWRYALWRRWGFLGHARFVAFCGLNPSTADESLDDPTIRRCIGFAKDWGYDGMFMLNAYAYRATDPKLMKAFASPVGIDNDICIRSICHLVDMVIAAWGVHCSIERERQVCQSMDKVVHCLGKTKDGRPRHPLYLRSDSRPEVFWTPKVEPVGGLTPTAGG